MTTRWLPLSISQTDLLGGFTIVLTTDVPCHLFLYWTDKVPWVHRTSKIDRGLPVPWDAYWCYVVWTLIDQQEPGDTTIHTYTWLGWQVCQTKYFRFHGTIAGNTSPSDSPIFHKHYKAAYVPPGIQEHFKPDPLTAFWPVSSDDGTGYAFIAEATYTLDHIVGWFTVRENAIDLDVAIYLADAFWKPSGAPLAQASIDPTGLNPWPNYLPKEIPLSGAAIAAGQKYAVTMLTDGVGFPTSWHVWDAAFPNPYKFLVTHDKGLTWDALDGAENIAFENWGG